LRNEHDHGLSVVISTHVFTTGPAHALQDYLITRASRLLFISHPFYFSKERSSFAESYSNGKLKRNYAIPALRPFGPLSYLRDFVLTILIVIRSSEKFTLFVGVDALNSLSGLILRKVGLVRKVVFYSIDYVPHRFRNGLLNATYHLLERFCNTKCDWTWNLSRSMINARIGSENPPNQMVVPIGSSFARINRKPIQEIRRHRIAYMGSLRPGQGIELAIDAMPKISQEIPNAELIIIGSGPLARELEDRAKVLGVQQNTIFVGPVASHLDVEDILTNCAVGLALYEPRSDSFTQYTEPGKIKVYMACGLPVITTRVPEISKDLDRNGAGILIAYNLPDLIEATSILLRDDQVYRSARESAIRFASEYSWEKIFDNAFSEMIGHNHQY